MFKVPRAQRGFMVLAIVVTLMTIALVVIGLKLGAITLASGQKVVGSQDVLTRIQQGLLRYVTVYGELPCPANPAFEATNSLAGYPNGFQSVPFPTPTCLYPGGVVPWKVLGLTANEVTDEWGRLISYRVFDGSIGLTQDQGASKTNCDTSNLDRVGRIAATDSTGVTTSETPPINGLCAPDHNTLETSFIQHQLFPTSSKVKGSIVNEINDGTTTVVSNIAYVLISHGPSGLRGWLQSGSQMTLPLATALDYPNTQSPTYYPGPPTAFIKTAAMAARDPTVVAGAAGHYDDVVTYLTIDDLVRLARLAAHDWPELHRSTTDIQNFNVTTTSNLTNTATTDHFIATTVNAGASATEQFQQALSGAGVTFGESSGTYSACLWWPNKEDLFGTTAKVISGATWASDAITFTTSASHGLAVGQQVIVSGVSPDGYNNTTSNPYYYVTAIPSSTTFKVTQTVNPGAWVSGGITRPAATLAFGTSWSGNVVTFTTTANHGFATGNIVEVAGSTPAAYEGTYTITGTPTATTFTASAIGDPGTWITGGTVTGIKRALAVSVDAAFSSADPGGGLVIGILPTSGYWVNGASPSTITIAPTLTITNAAWTWWSGPITFTTSETFPFRTGNTVVVTGMSVAAYNGTFTVTDTPTSTTFTVDRSSWPGAWSSSGGTVTGTLCGSSSSSVRIGWDNSGDGNLPTPRFAVEMDMQYNSSRNDPDNETHVAVDAAGVTHGSSNTATCSSTANTYNTITVATLATGTSWTNGVITFKTSTDHKLAIGNNVTVKSASPSGYNGNYTVTEVPTSTTFTVAQLVDPGTWSSGGTVGINDCYTGSSSAWLWDGLTSFHKARAEIEPMSSACRGTAPLLRYWLLPYSACSSLRMATTGTVWSSSNSGEITFQTITNHSLTTGNVIAVTGSSPSDYNGTYTVTGTPTSTTFTVARSVDPGTWSAGGTIKRITTLITGTTWSGGAITFKTSQDHGYVAGNAVTVTGALPTGYNGTFTITSVPTLTTFTVARATDPGSWVLGGSVTAQDCSDIEDVSILYAPANFPSGGVYLSKCVATPDPTNAYDSVYFGFTANNNNNFSTNTTANFNLRNLNSSRISIR